MKLIELHDVYQWGLRVSNLYWLLEERLPEHSISHKRMPTMEEHEAFVESRPYEAWYFIRTPLTPDTWVNHGAIYLTRQREIGIQVMRSSQRKGYAKQAITELMRLHPGRFLANINPANEASIALFRSLGFGGPIQITLEKPE